jgi:hypothetical protein
MSPSKVAISLHDPMRAAVATDKGAFVVDLDRDAKHLDPRQGPRRWCPARSDARNRSGQLLRARRPGGTFNGNPLMCAAGIAVVDEVSRPGFLSSVTEKGDALTALLASSRNVMSLARCAAAACCRPSRSASRSRRRSRRRRSKRVVAECAAAGLVALHAVVDPHAERDRTDGRDS